MVNHIPKILKCLLRRTEKANVKLELETANFKWFILLHIPKKRLGKCLVLTFVRMSLPTKKEKWSFIHQHSVTISKTHGYNWAVNNREVE